MIGVSIPYRISTVGSYEKNNYNGSTFCYSVSIPYRISTVGSFSITENMLVLEKESFNPLSYLYSRVMGAKLDIWFPDGRLFQSPIVSLQSGHK